MTKRETTNEILLTTVLTYATKSIDTKMMNHKYRMIYAALVLNGFDGKLKVEKEDSFDTNGIDFDKKSGVLTLCDKKLMEIDCKSEELDLSVTYRIFNIDTGKEFTREQINEVIEEYRQNGRAKGKKNKNQDGGSFDNILNTRNKSAVEQSEEIEEIAEQREEVAEEPTPIVEKPKDRLSKMIEDMVKKHAELKNIPYEEYSEPIMGLTRVYTARAKEHYDEFIASYKKWFPDAEI